jgi:hypothetical protein
MPEKPEVQLIGKDGNAYAILAACYAAGKKAGWTDEELEELMSDMKSGSYDHLLLVAMERFHVS